MISAYNKNNKIIFERKKKVSKHLLLLYSIDIDVYKENK